MFKSVVLLLSLGFLVAGQTYVTGNVVWTLGNNYITLGDAALYDYQGNLHSGTFYGWFRLIASGAGVNAGVTPTYASPSNNFVLFDINPSSAFSLDFGGTVRLDSSGWGVKHVTLTNPTAFPITVNLFAFEYLQSGLGTSILYTSNSNNVVENSDHWSISTDNVDQDPIVIESFGYVNTFFQSLYYFSFGTDVTVPAGQTVGFLELVGVVDPVQPNSYALNKALSVVDSALTLYNYVNPFNNVRLLSHLSPSELRQIANWNFGAVVGGDPHGVDFEGVHFDIPSHSESYCLFHGSGLQVNIRVGKHMGLIDEMVIFVRELGVVVHCGFNQDLDVEFSVNNEILEIPGQTFEGLITTESGPFSFFGPFGENSRYQTALLTLSRYVSVVGGWHPGLDGFFNVMVHHRSNELVFPSILQLRSLEPHRLPDSEFLRARIPHVWFSPESF